MSQSYDQRDMTITSMLVLLVALNNQAGLKLPRILPPGILALWILFLYNVGWT